MKPSDYPYAELYSKSGDCSRSRDAPGSVVTELVRRFRKEMATANAKEYVTDLTKDEACAICFFAEVPYSLDGESITFHACGLQKRNGVWTAFTSPNTESRNPETTEKDL